MRKSDAVPEIVTVQAAVGHQFSGCRAWPFGRPRSHSIRSCVAAHSKLLVLALVVCLAACLVPILSFAECRL